VWWGVNDIFVGCKLAMSKPRFLGSNPFDLAIVPTKKRTLVFPDYFFALSLSNQLVFLSSENFWNKSIWLLFVPKKIWNTFFCSSLLLKILERLCWFLFASEKFWNILVYSSLLRKSLGTPLFVPLRS